MLAFDGLSDLRSGPDACLLLLANSVDSELELALCMTLFPSNGMEMLNIYLIDKEIKLKHGVVLRASARQVHCQVPYKCFASARHLDCNSSADVLLTYQIIPRAIDGNH